MEGVEREGGAVGERPGEPRVAYHDECRLVVHGVIAEGARRVAEAQAQGDLAGADATGVAQGLMCVVQGLALNFVTLSEYPWRDPQALARLTIRGYLGGLAAKPVPKAAAACPP